MSLFEKGIVIWFVAIAAGGVWLYTSTDRQEAKAAATQPQPETQPPASGANIIPEAKAAVQAGLRDPDSAKFKDVITYGTGNNRTVCGNVNAKNGYGGYVGYYPFMYEEMTKKVSSGKFEGTGDNLGTIDDALRRAIQGLCESAANKQGKATSQ